MDGINDNESSCPPKDANIIHERDVAAGERHIHIPLGVKIVRNQDGTVTKLRRRGFHCLRNEANIMGRARELGVPVPKIYNLEPKLVEGTDGPWYGITMDFVEGESLEDVWANMTAPERKSIAQQIARIGEILRTVRQPEAKICSWRECESPMLPAEYDSGVKLGCMDEAKFVQQMLRCRSMKNWERDSFANRLPQSGSRIMLSHGDLRERNILVKDGKVTAVLSWQHAGMFPEYWEYVQLCRRASYDELAEMVTGLWPKSYTKINAIWQEVEGFGLYVPMGVFKPLD